MVKFLQVLTGGLIALTVFGVPSASAATEFGDSCVADQAAENPLPGTVFALTAPGNPDSLTAPSSGVITKWKINQSVSPAPFPQTLKVLRQTSPATVQFVGESAQTVNPGLNTFETRIPVQAGDRLGLFGVGKPGLVLCKTTGSLSRIGIAEGSSSVGSSANFMEIETEARIPAAAIVEPDADNDGFGDETQDQCPQNAAVQTTCPAPAPPAGLSASSAVKRGLVTVFITSTTQTQVTVTGTTKLGKGKTAKLNGGTQIVAPGTIARFTVLFPKKLKDRLKQLSPKQRLTLKLAATARNAAGQPTTTTALKVRVKGQAKPKPKKRRGQAPAKR